MGVIGSIAAIIGTLASVGTGIYSMTRSTPKPVSLPPDDMANLNKQIAENTRLSNEARATATQALNDYNQGVLSSAYAGNYQSQYDQNLQQVKQQLAAQGYTEGSTQYESAMQQFSTWAANLKSQMLQSQLNDSLKAAGISDTAINDLYGKWGLMNQGTYAGIASQNAANQNAYGAGKAIGGAGSNVSDLLKPDSKSGGAGGNNEFSFTTQQDPSNMNDNNISNIFG
jgi:hypothetical protein